MIAFLLGVLLTLSPVDSTASLDDCLTIGPQSAPPPIASLSEAQKTWVDGQSVSRDTLLNHLSRVLAARDCYHELRASRIERPYLANVLRTYKAEAVLRAALRQFSKAFAAYDAGLSYLRSRSPDDFVGYTEAYADWPQRLYQGKGYLHYLLGNLSSSIEHYLRAYESASAVHERIEHLLNVGILHQRAQDYSSAHHYYQRAQNRLASDSLSDAARRDLHSRAYLNQADLLLEKTLNAEFDRDELTQARNYAERARSRGERGTEQFARITSVLSESLGYLGAFEEAYRLNEEVRRYAQAHDASRLHVVSLLKLGVLHIQTEQWARGDSTLHNALELAENLGDLDLQRRILRARGRLYEMQEEWTDAEATYRVAVSVVEEYRESLTASQWSMTAFAQWRDVHRGLARSLIAQDRVREALMVLDRSRARHLEDLRTQARVSNDLSSDQRTRLDSLSRALTDVRTRLSNGSLPDSTTAALQNREAMLMADRQQLLQTDTGTPRPTLSQISETLAEQDRTVVSYFLDNPWPVYDRSPRSTAFVLTADTLRTVPLSNLTQDSVRSTVERISPIFTTPGPPNHANSIHFDLEPLHALHQAIYAPIREHLPSGQGVTFVPDGPLFHVPFSMLVDSMPGGRYAPSEADFVVHERPTSLELSSSLITDSGATYDWSQFEPRLAAYGVSNFDTLDTVPPGLRTMLPKTVQDSSVHLPALPGVQRELRALQSSVSNAEVSLNQAATESAFSQSVHTAGILHVASHAFVNASSPLENAILLRRDTSTKSGSDGVLFLHELQRQQAEIPLVVLSGCNTARGPLRGGEGMEGLQYAFRAMGAQSTVSALWPVDDDASVTLMESFYGHLNDGLAKDRALRQAQLDYLDAHPMKASPFFWAPPVLYGSPSSVSLNTTFIIPVWAWGLLLSTGALVLVGGLLWWKRDYLPRPYCGGPSPRA